MLELTLKRKRLSMFSQWLNSHYFSHAPHLAPEFTVAIFILCQVVKLNSR